MSRAIYRKTRIVCISDTHNQTPSLPSGDILIHAGDLTNQGSLSELQKQLAWLRRAPHEVKIVIAGNHDTSLDRKFFADGHGARMHNQVPQDPEQSIRLLKEAEGITYLCHEEADIILTAPDGSRTRCKLFGSPYSPARGSWAFGYDTSDDGFVARQIWAAVPTDIDVLVTHTPPAGYCDTFVPRKAGDDSGVVVRVDAPRAGCQELTRRLGAVRPRLHVCGHMHEGRGCERVVWPEMKLESAAAMGPSFQPLMVERWVDPGGGLESKKQSLVDLTGKRSRRLNILPLHLNDRTDEGDPSELGLTTRRETCIVNAAIMNQSRLSVPRVLNRPIVVDLLLPVSDG